MGITGNGGAAGAPEQAIDGQACFFACDVPQSHVDAAQCGAENGTVAPITAGEHALPVVFNVTGFTTNESGGDCFDGFLNGVGVEDVRCRADAIEAGLVGEYFDKEPRTIGSGADAFDVGDFGHGV